MWKSAYILGLLYCMANAITYNSYRREPATEEEIKEYEAKNNMDICIANFEPCDKHEWRRVDGSCNNLDHPSHGMFHTPEIRLLPANYSEENYVLQTTDCCEASGLDNPMCTPNLIPVNDNVHRFSGYNCINMTRPKTFQTEGCASSETVPNRITKATTYMDLSSTYLHANASAIKDHRTYKGGKLKVEVVNGIALPSDAVEGTTCLIKQARETGCTRNVPNTILGTNIFSAWYWRQHNMVAEKLAALNPCWDDEKLFHIAMDINIACYNQLVFYELYAEFLGKENMVKQGILGSGNGHRDLYDKSVIPGMYTEYGYVLRWFHVTQDGNQELYDKHGTFVGTTPMVNFSLRVQDLAYDDNMPRLTQGLFRQPAGDFGDWTAHTDLTEVGLGPLQKNLDILTNDLAKGRFFGFTSYLQYRDFCTNYTKKHESFEDLEDVMEKNKIDELRRVYENPWDIELMAGIWSENLMEGAWVPPTAHCILSHQLKRLVVTDRHWYERPNRPYAFTKDQLHEIRKASYAQLLCAVGDDVVEIQPKAFLRIGPGNELVSCKKIPQLNFSLWKDKSCKVK